MSEVISEPVPAEPKAEAKDYGDYMADQRYADAMFAAALRKGWRMSKLKDVVHGRVIDAPPAPERATVERLADTFQELLERVLTNMRLSGWDTSTPYRRLLYREFKAAVSVQPDLLTALEDAEAMFLSIVGCRSAMVCGSCHCNAEKAATVARAAIEKARGR